MFLFFQSCTENIKNLDAEQIAQDSLILDSHIDVPYRLWRQHLEGLEIDDISAVSYTHLTLPTNSRV